MIEFAKNASECKACLNFDCETDIVFATDDYSIPEGYEGYEGCGSECDEEEEEEDEEEEEEEELSKKEKDRARAKARDRKMFQ